jgi:dTDP-L-rhamnose 4-epimerase
MFSLLARDGKSIPIYEDGAITRDFIYIDDVAEAIVAAMRKPPVTDGRRTLDIGSGRASTILELAEEVAAYYGAPEPHINGKYRDGDVRHAACEIDDARADLGWEPHIDLTAGVALLQRWIASRDV